MAYSVIQICNLALAHLGVEPIINFDPPLNTRVRLCDALYPASRDEMLSAFAWSFAKQTQALNASVDTHPEGTVYVIPQDCLTPIELVPVYQPPRPWFREGLNIIVPEGFEPLSNDVLYLRYIKTMTDTRFFSFKFISALAYLIAARAALPLTKSEKLKSSLFALYERTQKEAQQEDAMQGEGRDPQSNPDYDSFNTFVE